MGEDDTEIIRESYRAWNRGDIDGFVARYHPEVEVRPFLGDLSGSVYRGHDGVRRWYKDANEPWDQMTAEPDDINSYGGRSVIFVHACARGHASGMEIDAHIVHVALIEDGLIVRLEGFSSEQDALRALDVEIEAEAEAKTKLETDSETHAETRSDGAGGGRVSHSDASRRTRQRHSLRD